MGQIMLTFTRMERGAGRRPGGAMRAAQREGRRVRDIGVASIVACGGEGV